MLPAPKLAPTGWPIVRPGLLMTYVGPICFIYFGDRLTEEGERVHAEALAKAIDDRTSHTRIGVVCDHAMSNGVSALGRSAIANVLAGRKSTLESKVVGFALVSDSVFVRGMLKAIFWVAPPPYAHAAKDSVRQAIDFVATCVGGVHVGRTHSEYLEMLDRHRAVIGGR